MINRCWQSNLVVGTPNPYDEVTTVRSHGENQRVVALFGSCLDEACDRIEHPLRCLQYFGEAAHLILQLNHHGTSCQYSAGELCAGTSIGIYLASPLLERQPGCVPRSARHHCDWLLSSRENTLYTIHDALGNPVLGFVRGMLRALGCDGAFVDATVVLSFELMPLCGVLYSLLRDPGRSDSLLEWYFRGAFCWAMCLPIVMAVCRLASHNPGVQLGC